MQYSYTKYKHKHTLIMRMHKRVCVCIYVSIIGIQIPTGGGVSGAGQEDLPPWLWGQVRKHTGMSPLPPVWPTRPFPEVLEDLKVGWPFSVW